MCVCVCECLCLGGLLQFALLFWGGVPGGLKRPLEVLKPSPVFAPLPEAEGMLGILADQIMGSISKPPTLLNVQRIAKTVPLKSAVCPLAARIKWPWRRHLPYLGQWDPCAKNRWFHLFIPPPFFFFFPVCGLCIIYLYGREDSGYGETPALPSLRVTFLLPHPDPGTPTSKTGGDTPWGPGVKGWGVEPRTSTGQQLSSPLPLP